MRTGKDNFQQPNTMDTTTTTNTQAAKVKPFNEQLHARLLAVKVQHGWTLTDLQKMLGNSPAAISKYLNGKPEGDVKALEAKLEDLVINAELRAQMPEEDKRLFHTLVVKQISNTCDIAKRNAMMGMVIGEPGLGKSCALKMYADADPWAIRLELNTVTGGGTPTAMVRAFWRRINTASFAPKEQSKGEWLLDRFTGTGRLLIIDNAHLLSEKGLEWVLGFHDGTGCPVVLVGNSELATTMRKVQRGPSRIGVTTKCDLKRTTAEVAKAYLEKTWPEAVADLAGLAAEVVERPGALRALRQVVSVAKGWYADGKRGAGTFEDAFRMALAKQVVDYKLAA